MYWKPTEGSGRLRLKAGRPMQTVAAVGLAADGWGYCAYGYARGKTVWSSVTPDRDEAKRRAEAWARRNGFHD